MSEPAEPASRGTWLPAALVVVLVAALAAVWRFTGLREWFDAEELAIALEPFRRSWFALPLTLVVFVVAELVMFPVLLLIFACGVVFGPWLGAVYALLGALVSALVPFWIGRRLGRDTVAKRGGRIVQRIENVLERRGIVAVFLVRKIPAPYTLVNLVCGASTLTVRDFVIGTLLGMGTGVVLITVLGGQLVATASEPEPWQIVAGIVMLFVPLVLALWLQRWINRHDARTVPEADEHRR